MNLITFTGAIALFAARAVFLFGGPHLRAILSVFAKSTRRIAVTLGGALLCVGLLSNCANLAYRKVQRQMGSIQRTLQKYPELADTLNWNKPTVLTAIEYRDSLKYVPQVDTHAVDSLAGALYLAQKVAGLEAHKPPIEVIREKLIRAACPEVEKTKVFELKLTVNDTTISLPLTVVFNSAQGLTVHLPERKFTVSENKTAINFTQPDPPFYAISWFWAFVAAILVWVIFIFVKVIK